MTRCQIWNLLDRMRFRIQLRTHRMPSWCLRRVRPSRSGSPQRGLWYIACWDPISACVAARCFRASPSAGLWNEAASFPKWNRNSQGRIPAFGRTTSTSTQSPWRGSSFECVESVCKSGWVESHGAQGGVVSSLFFPHCSPFLLAQAVNHTRWHAHQKLHRNEDTGRKNKQEKSKLA